MTHLVPLVVHAGYPKTATTTFQSHVFPSHPDIEYLGKFIPSFGYVDNQILRGIDNILHQDTLRFRGAIELSELVQKIRRETTRKCVLISSESFIHPSVVDLAIVADRIRTTFGPCKVLITIREQISAIMSFYAMHGRFGQYLTIGPKEEGELIDYPLSFSHWLRFQRSAALRNYLGILHYDAVIMDYVEKFRPQNVCVLLYESFVAEPDLYAEHLGAFLGIEVSMLRTLMSGKHELRSEGARANSRGPGDLGMLARLASAVGRLQDGAPPEFPEAELDSLRQQYRWGNARLVRELSLPLDRYGYSV